MIVLFHVDVIHCYFLCLLLRLQIFGDPHFSNYSCSEVPSLPILSSQNEQTVGTTISLTSASSIPLVPFPQAGASSPHLHVHLLYTM